MDCSPPGSSVQGISQEARNTGAVCHFLLQGIFLTQGSNPSLLHWQADSLPLSHQGSPRLLLLMLFSEVQLWKKSVQCWEAKALGCSDICHIFELSWIYCLCLGNSLSYENKSHVDDCFPRFPFSLWSQLCPQDEPIVDQIRNWKLMMKPTLWGIHSAKGGGVHIQCLQQSPLPILSSGDCMFSSVLWCFILVLASKLGS